MDDRRRRRPDRRDSDAARRHETEVVCRHDGADQDRAGPRGAVRARLPWRRAELAARDSDPHRLLRRAHHVVAAAAGRCAYRRRMGTDRARPRVRRGVRHLGDRLSRRHPRTRSSKLRRCRDDDTLRRPDHANRRADRLPLALRPRAPDGHLPRLAPVRPRRLHGRLRLADVVPRLRARKRRQGAHARIGRDLLRPARLAQPVQAGPRLPRRSSGSG